MAGLLVAMERRQGMAQAIQAQAIRAAVWGDAEAFTGFVGALTGVVPDQAETGIAEALAGFGLRQM